MPWNPVMRHQSRHESLQSQLKQQLVNILVFAVGLGSTIAGYKNNSVPVTVLGVIAAVGSLMSSSFSHFKSAPRDVEAQAISRDSANVPLLSTSPVEYPPALYPGPDLWDSSRDKLDLETIETPIVRSTTNSIVLEEFDNRLFLLPHQFIHPYAYVPRPPSFDDDR